MSTGSDGELDVAGQPGVGSPMRYDDPFAPVFPPEAQSVRVDCSGVRSWDDFHTAFAIAMGFPDFYGRNMDAWIDCMGDLRDDSRMTRFRLERGQLLQVEVVGSERFRSQAADVFDSFLEAVTFVNVERGRGEGYGPLLSLVLV